MINLKAPERGSDAERADRGSAGVLVVAMDDAGLAEALPIAYARAASLGARVTVAGPAKMPFWWAVAASGLLFWVWRISWPRDAEGTKRLAEEEGRTRVTDTSVLVAAVASLAAVVEALVRSGTRDVVGVATVAIGTVSELQRRL